MTLPIVSGTFRGAWQTNYAYVTNDVITYQGIMYVVNTPFTSTATFDPTNLTAVESSVVREGTNARMGLAVLVGGTVVVNTTAVTADSRIFLTTNVPGGTPGFLRVSARTAGTSFTILSSSGSDTSSVAWLIVEPTS